jgi:hypothetical protein
VAGPPVLHMSHIDASKKDSILVAEACESFCD